MYHAIKYRFFCYQEEFRSGTKTTANYPVRHRIGLTLWWPSRSSSHHLDCLNSTDWPHQHLSWLKYMEPYYKDLNYGSVWTQDPFILFLQKYPEQAIIVKYIHFQCFCLRKHNSMLWCIILWVLWNDQIWSDAIKSTIKTFRPRWIWSL